MIQAKEYLRRHLSLIYNILALLGGTSLARLASAVALVVLARVLGVESFGQYTAILALLRISSIVFSLGLDSWLLYTCGNTPEAHNLAPAWTIAAITKGGAGVLWLGGVALLGHVWNHNTFTSSLLFLGGVSIWFEELASVGWAVFKATLKNQTTFVLMTLFQGALLIGVVIGAVLGVKSVEGFFVIRGVFGAVVAVLTLVLLARRFGFQLLPAKIFPAIRASLPFGLSMFLARVYGRADLALVAYYLGRQAAGLYGLAVSLLMTVMLIPASVYGVALPYLSGIFRQHPFRLKQAMRINMIGQGMVGGVLTCGVLFAAHPLVRFMYGDAYRPASDLLRVLSVILLVRALSLGLAAMLVAVGLQKQRLMVQGIVALCNVVGNVLIIQRFRLSGVAFMYVVSESMLMIGYAVLLIRWRRHRVERLLEVSRP